MLYPLGDFGGIKLEQNKKKEQDKVVFNQEVAKYFQSPEESEAFLKMLDKTQIILFGRQWFEGINSTPGYSVFTVLFPSLEKSLERTLGNDTSNNLRHGLIIRSIHSDTTTAVPHWEILGDVNAQIRDNIILDLLAFKSNKPNPKDLQTSVEAFGVYRVDNNQLLANRRKKTTRQFSVSNPLNTSLMLNAEKHIATKFGDKDIIQHTQLFRPVWATNNGFQLYSEEYFKNLPPQEIFRAIELNMQYMQPV